MTAPLLDVIELSKRFTLRGGRQLQAVDRVSLSLKQGQTLGVVGESGCGKSTLGRLILRLLEPSSGAVRFMGHDITLLSGSQLREVRKHLQVIFQDPQAALDPRMTVGRLIEEPLVIHRMGSAQQRASEIARLLDTVGLPPEAAKRYPHEFSGGQRQRICIARALALQPQLIVADEPVSALDVSIQSQVLNLLGDLQRERGLSYLFISHNLAVVKYLSDTVAVMYLGRVVEMGDAEQVFGSPKHPYTQALLAAIPEPEPLALAQRRKADAAPLLGELPSPDNLPTGCRFHTRCAQAMERCKTQAPEPVQVGTAAKPHWVECHLWR
jgi:oligopeptide/dipeptide ABC transporter ATP-binding protein